MSTSDPKRLPKVDDPGFQRLIEDLQRLPEFLAEKRRKRLERQRFVRRVFGKAVEQAFGPSAIPPEPPEDLG